MNEGGVRKASPHQATRMFSFLPLDGGGLFLTAPHRVALREGADETRCHVCGGFGMKGGHVPALSREGRGQCAQSWTGGAK